MPETVETPSDEATPLPTVEAVSAPRRAQGMRQVLSRVGRAVASGAVFAAKKSGAFVRARPRTASLMVGVGLAAIVAPVALRSRGAAAAPPPSPAPSVVAEAKPALPLAKPYQPVSGLTGVDLKAMTLDDTGGVAPAGVGRVAKLTVDPKLQLAVSKLLAKHKLPQVAAVMIEPSTGKILAYSSKETGQPGPHKDLNVEAFAPSASVFKVVTGSALVQVAGVSPDFKSCYNGGEQKITPLDLKDDPKQDKWCATLAQAMGRSINTIFARLASKKLTPPDLNTIASQMGYGAPIPFDVPLAVSKIDLPTDTLGFARTAAGFWNTTLSPVHGALLAATIANGGVTMRPWIVSEVREGNAVAYKAPGPSIYKKALDPATAAAVEKMMAETVSQGTSFKAFHDAKGKAFLPGIEVAGKTGTLNQPQPLKLFTWFVGYAPIKNPKVAIAVLVVNDPVWKVKANVVAREALQAYFAQQGAANVQSPSYD